jgi:hypothetical protein
MSIVVEIEKQYLDIERYYSSKEFEAFAASNAAEESYWLNRREMNTHAYFLFLFTRLEDHIKTESSKLISSKILASVDWKERAVWDICNDGELSLKKKLALLTEKGRTDYNTIVEYYQIRNDIGHGKTIADISRTINMREFFEDLKNYFTSLKA